MPTKPTAAKKNLMFTAWSYSRFSDWRKCPAMSMFKHLMKLKEPDNEYQARGTIVHKEAELWSTKKTVGQVELGSDRRKQTVKVSATKIPESLKCFKEEFVGLRKIARSLATEQQVGLDARWGHTEWFDSDAARKGLAAPWCRVTMDCRYVVPAKGGPRVLKIIDYKTGRVRDENQEQLSLYAVAGFELEPEVEAVEAELWYLDQGELVPLVFTRDEAPRLKKEWEKKVKPMFGDRQFRPKRSGLCARCHYRKSNGGPCKFE